MVEKIDVETTEHRLGSFDPRAPSHESQVDWAGKPTIRPTPTSVSRICHSSTCFNEIQDPIYWRYLPYIRPIFQAYVRGYPPKIWPYMVQYLHFRILEFPLNVEQNPKSGHAQAVRKLVQCIGYCGWLQNPSHQLIDGKHHIILFGFITVYPTKRMVETVETLNPVGCNVMFTIYQLIIRIMEKQHYGYGHGMDMSSIFTGHVPYLCEITKCVQDVFFSRCFRTIIPGFQCFYQ